MKISSAQGGLSGPLDDGDAFGGAVARLGDGEGGAHELVVGAPRDDDGGADRGAVYLLALDRAICGDGDVEFGESCDDANPFGLDGCSPSCALQDAFALSGIAQGGSVSLVIAGVTIFAATSPGQSASEVLEALAAEIAADPVLAGLGVTASVEGPLLVVDGAVIEEASVDDPGLAPPAVPALSLATRLLLCGAVVAAWGQVVQRASGPARGGSSA
jgi:cysteine-rich repeat protein